MRQGLAFSLRNFRSIYHHKCFLVRVRVDRTEFLITIINLGCKHQIFFTNHKVITVILIVNWENFISVDGI
jgi:hypothetical protein